MARTQGAQTANAIAEVAASLFNEHGYEATSLRQIASEVGIQVGSLYNHIDGKNELLHNIMVGILDDLLDAIRNATAAGTDPVSRLVLALDCHIRFHALRSRDVFIGNSELRSLPPENRADVINRRDAYEEILRDLVSDVVHATGADPLDVRLQTYAILAIGTHVSSWYRPDGDMSLDDVVAGYTRVILRQLGIEEFGMRVGITTA